MHVHARVAALATSLGVSLAACGGPPPAPVKPAPVVAAPAPTPAPPARPNTAGWQSFADGERFGFKDARGQVVLPAKYELVQEFTAGGLACVVEGGAWVCIDGNGKPLVRPFIVDNGPDGFSEGLARFVDEGNSGPDGSSGKLGFFDETGARTISARFVFVTPFASGRAAFCVDCKRQCEAEHCSVVGGKWGLIDRTGTEVVLPRFDAISTFVDGAADAVLDGKPSRIDVNGAPLPVLAPSAPGSSPRHAPKRRPAD